jgi:hypothetical protein
VIADLDTGVARGLGLVADVDRRRRVVTDEHDGQRRGRPRCAQLARRARDLGPQPSGDRLAVDPDRLAAARHG